MNELVGLKERFEVIAQSTEEFPVDFDEAWQWVGYARKDSALRTLQTNFDQSIDFNFHRDVEVKEGLDFDSTGLWNQKTGRGGDRRTIRYFLTVDCFKSFCMMTGTPKGKEVRRYYIQIEKAWNTPELVMARAQQMRVIPNWKSPPAARIKEIRIAYDKGTVTVNEYRRQAFNLPPFEIDAPLERPGKGKAQKAEPEEKYRPSDELLRFVDENIEFTGNPNDFVRLPDLYDRYILKVENPLSRWSFIYTLKGAFSLISRQKRLGGYPTHVFIGCRFKEIRS